LVVNESEASWSAPAERSGDGAFARRDVTEMFAKFQSGVALRLPPQSKTSAKEPALWSGL
jgi:hypothetical protein